MIANPMLLTFKEIMLILEVLEAKYGIGYAEDKEVGKLQAKLSILLEVASKREDKADEA